MTLVGPEFGYFAVSGIEEDQITRTSAWQIHKFLEL
jgi:hypothetical protein